MPCISVSGRSAHGSHLPVYLLRLLRSMNKGSIHRVWQVRYFSSSFHFRMLSLITYSALVGSFQDFALRVENVTTYISPTKPWTTNQRSTEDRVRSCIISHCMTLPSRPKITHEVIISFRINARNISRWVPIPRPISGLPTP